jgi:uncharacterized phage protein gp47/JayE
MALLLPPDLDIRNEEQLAALMIGRVSGGLTTERIDSQLEALQLLRVMVAVGGLPQPVCPELSNANPSSPHTVLLEVIAWSLAQMARRINQLPVRDEIEFANLFIDGPRPAMPATATLSFTAGALPELDLIAVVPAGTRVSTADRSFVLETVDGLFLAGAETATVAAVCITTGPVLLLPNTLTVMVDAIAYIDSVTNPAAVDSGSSAETVDQALARARNFQRRALRLVSAKDVEDFIFEEVLQRNGIVKVFPFVKAGDFGVYHAGHSTIVVMTSTGAVVSDEIKAAIVDGLAQLIGSQFVYLLDPQFVTFNVEAEIKIEGIAPQLTIKAAVERNLRAFYATRPGNFGRRILRSEVIAVIEGTPGVDRINSDEDGPIVGSPAADVVLAPYQLPKLVSVTLTVVP